MLETAALQVWPLVLSTPWMHYRRTWKLHFPLTDKWGTRDPAGTDCVRRDRAAGWPHRQGASETCQEPGCGSFRSLYTVCCIYGQTSNQIHVEREQVSSTDKPERVRRHLLASDNCALWQRERPSSSKNLASSTGKWLRIPAQAPELEL